MKDGSTVDRTYSVAWAEVTIDCQDPQTLAAFWSELLAVELGRPAFPGWARTRSTVPGGPFLNFQPVAEPKVGKSRLHLDVWTDDLQATAEWVCQHGGAYTGEVHADKAWTVAVMTDPEGTEFCIVGPAGSAPPAVELAP
jgi:predicted enzyme related to lactoylglutathione lyase